MTPAEIDAIAARAEAATAGPWRDYDFDVVGGGGGYEDTAAKVRGGGMEMYLQSRDLIGKSMLAENAEFIAAARTDVPALIAALREARRDLNADPNSEWVRELREELREARADNERLRQAIADHACAHCPDCNDSHLPDPDAAKLSAALDGPVR